MKNKRRITGIVAALVLAIIGTLALWATCNRRRTRLSPAKPWSMSTSSTNSCRRAPRRRRSSPRSRSSTFPSRLKQSGAITDLDAVGSNVAATDLQPGDQLLAARLVPKDQVSEEVTDKVQISTVLAAERAVGGSLQKGDLVGVYLSFEPFDLNERRADHPVHTGARPGDCRSLRGCGADEVCEHDPTGVPARVGDQRADDRRSGERRRKDTTGIAQVTGSQYVVTLALSPEQSERFVFATEFGHVWLSNEPATVSDDGTRLVTLGNVYSVVK